MANPVLLFAVPRQVQIGIFISYDFYLVRSNMRPNTSQKAHPLLAGYRGLGKTVWRVRALRRDFDDRGAKPGAKSGRAVPTLLDTLVDRRFVRKLLAWWFPRDIYCHGNLTPVANSRSELLHINFTNSCHGKNFAAASERGPVGIISSYPGNRGRKQIRSLGWSVNRECSAL